MCQFQKQNDKKFQWTKAVRSEWSGVCKKKNIQERKTRQILCYNEYDRHTVQTNLVVFHYQLSNLMVECSLMCSKVFSHWLANFIKADHFFSWDIQNGWNIFVLLFSFSFFIFLWFFWNLWKLIWWPKIIKNYFDKKQQRDNSNMW